MAIALASAPAACVGGVTGEGQDGKAVIVLITVVIVRGVKSNIN
jgi:hypothetical protein